jgi:hypothetical protein
MEFNIGMENDIEGRSLAWVLDHPGCFAYGAEAQTAMAAVPAAIREYAAWIERHSLERWLEPGEIKIEMVDTWQVYCLDEQFGRIESSDHSINAWFLHDWKPLTVDKVTLGLKLLAWSRADLLETVKDLSPENLDKEYTGERWNIAGILNHVGGAEWWYLDRLGLAPPQEQVPKIPFDRLEFIRFHLNETIPTLIGSHQVIGVDGEFWSPRKLLRRAVWHERDHTTHIRQLLVN